MCPLSQLPVGAESVNGGFNGVPFERTTPVTYGSKVRIISFEPLSQVTTPLSPIADLSRISVCGKSGIIHGVLQMVRSGVRMPLSQLNR